MAASEPLFLFDRQGNPIEDYAFLVQAIEPGQVLGFHNGQMFTVQSVLGRGEGRSSAIFAVDAQTAIRIPLTAGDEHRAILDEFLDLNEELRVLGVPVVQVDKGRSLRGQYVKMERLEPHPALNQLISLEHFARGVIPEKSILFAVMAASLVEFAEKSFLISQFGDQGARQVLFTKKGWVLADYREGNQVAKSSSDAIPFRAEAVARSRETCEAQLKFLISTSLGNSWRERMLLVPASLEMALRLAVFRKRVEHFGLPAMMKKKSIYSTTFDLL